MSHKQGKTTGMIILVAVILIAFLFVTPLFRYSCSRVVMQDFLGMDGDMTGPGLLMGPGNLIHIIPLVVMLLLWGAVTLWVYHDA